MKNKIKLEQLKLEQLEQLDTPNRLMTTHTIDSYWIPSKKKTVKVTNLKNLPYFKVFNFETNVTRDKPSEVAW